MRHHFETDAGADRALFELLDRVFPGLAEGAALLRPFGTSWESISRPWVALEDGRPVAHVGVIPLPLVVAGQPQRVGSVHAVATHPDRRRRGFMRQLLEEMFHDTAAEFPTLVLTTDQPEIYTPFGFRPLGEVEFRVDVSAAGTAGGFRRLEIDAERDRAVLLRLLATRAPVSGVVGVGPAPAVFLFNEWRHPLWYDDSLDTLLCLTFDGHTLSLYDVVSPRPPRLDAILDRLPFPAASIVLHFAPDLVAPGAAITPVPRLFDHGGPSYLMARGPFAAETAAFTLPRTGRT